MEIHETNSLFFHTIRKRYPMVVYGYLGYDEYHIEVYGTPNIVDDPDDEFGQWVDGINNTFLALGLPEPVHINSYTVEETADEHPAMFLKYQQRLRTLSRQLRAKEEAAAR